MKFMIGYGNNLYKGYKTKEITNKYIDITFTTDDKKEIGLYIRKDGYRLCIKDLITGLYDLQKDVTYEI